METTRIAELLKPFVDAPLTYGQLEQISIYVDILTKWNLRMNLTAVRDPEEMVRRHFGESLFAAARVLPSLETESPGGVIDVGSGAGFPGLPFKIFEPSIELTMLEANQKKVTFLRETVRAMALPGVTVSCARAEDYDGASAAVVTLRAVERFENILPVAARLVRPGGRFVLLIGERQVQVAQAIVPEFAWGAPTEIPSSDRRVVLIGSSPREQESTQ